MQNLERIVVEFAQRVGITPKRYETKEQAIIDAAAKLLGRWVGDGPTIINLPPPKNIGKPEK